MNRDSRAQAAIRRVLFSLFAVGAVCALAGPSNLVQPPDFAPVGPSGGADARVILERFREAGLAQPYYLEFQLQEIPRRGDISVFSGRLWGARNEQGLILRIAVKDGAGREHRFLLQNGAEPQGWSCSGQGVEELGAGDMFRPVIEGVNVTPFDLQMPYLYWPDYRLAGVSRILGRPADQFLFRAAPASGPNPGPTAVRAYFDSEFGEPVRTELLGADGLVQKTLSLVDLKRVGRQWIPKEVDVRDESKRDKTRIFVTAAALGLDLSPALFLPGELSRDVAAPDKGLISRFPP